mmetsp:Transcript_34792/g.55795  ORF Transcript_34792/g.55795 Transcript_34792/m.55795 type:complete len:858 (-) Transcript_34792:2434-5007(-)
MQSEEEAHGSIHDDSSSAQNEVASKVAGSAQRHKSRNIPVKAIHHLNKQVSEDGMEQMMGGSAGGTGLGGSVGAQGVVGVGNVVSAGSNSPIATGSRRGGNPSPVPVRKSPRSSPRTSPLPHRGSSPAHCRSPSPHFNSRSSPRSSTVSGGSWSGVVRNKSPQLHNKLQTSSSAFNKVKPSSKRGFQPQQQTQQQLSAFTGVTGKDSATSVSAGSGNSTGTGVHVPLVLSSGGSLGNGRNSRSPVLVSGIPRNLMPSSPKGIISKSTSSSKSSGRGSSASGPTSKPIHQRQDPTSRDLEFLMGSRDDELFDDPGFGSDNELIYYVDSSQARSVPFEKSVRVRRRPTSSNASTSSGSGGASTALPSSEHEVVRPKSCTVNCVQTLSPTFDSRRRGHSQSSRPGSALSNGSSEAGGIKVFDPQYSDDVDRVDSTPSTPTAEASGENGASGQPVHARGRSGAALSSTTQRWRSSSWDSLRSQQSHNNCGGKPRQGMDAKQMAQASFTRQQLKLQQQQKLQMQLQEHQQKHQMEQQLLQQQQGVKNPQQMMQEPVALEAMSGMSLEDVFKLERMLNSYKAQLLRDRVLGGEQQSVKNSKRQSKDVSQMSTEEYTAVLENEFLVEKGAGPGYAPPHPPERCNSGNCILDDMDDNVVGAMDFDDYEATYQFNQYDEHNGMRAPNFKMFKSCDRGEFVSPVSGSSMTPSSVEEASAMEEYASKFESSIGNLSRSPGNISFISRTRLNKTPPVVRMKSPPSLQQLNQVKNSIDASLTSPDPSKGIGCISSPRSAFHRASNDISFEQRPVKATSLSSSLSINTTSKTASTNANGRTQQHHMGGQQQNPRTNPSSGGVHRGRSNVPS